MGHEEFGEIEQAHEGKKPIKHLISSPPTSHVFQGHTRYVMQSKQQRNTPLDGSILGNIQLSQMANFEASNEYVSLRHAFFYVKEC